jgi:hypothetical protein
MANHGQSSEETSGVETHANAPKWESYLERTQYEGIWQAISSGPLPCYPPTKTI